MRRLSAFLLLLALPLVARGSAIKPGPQGNYQFPGAIMSGPILASNLPALTLPNGFQIWCQDCNTSCATGGTGVYALRSGNAWTCTGGGGGGGTPPGGLNGNLQINNAGVFGPYGGATCAAGNAIQILSASGAPTCLPIGGATMAFSAITAGTNTSALTMGSGGIITSTGTGAVVASDLRSTTSSVNLSSSIAPVAGQVLTALNGISASWQNPAGTGTVTHTVGPLTANAGVIGNGTADAKVLGSTCGGSGVAPCFTVDNAGNMQANTLTTNDQNVGGENAWTLPGNNGMSVAPSCAGRAAKTLTLVDTSNQGSDSLRTYHYCVANIDGPTLPVSNDFLMTRSSVDVLTNKTFDTAGTGNTFKVNGVQVSALGATNAPPKTLATLSGAYTLNHCIQVDANGNLVDSGAACGGGGGGAVSNSLNLMLPMGLNGGPAPLNASTQTLIMVAGTLYCYPFVPSITLQNATKLSWYVNTGQPSAHCSVGIWNDAGTTLLMNSAALACAITPSLFTVTGLTPTTLTAGTRYQACFTTDQTNEALEGYGGGSGQGVLVLNAFVPKQGQRAGATSGGSQPASTGAMTSGQYPLPYLLISTE